MRSLFKMSQDFVSLSSLSSFRRLSTHARHVLSHITFDRAVLINEVSDFVINKKLGLAQSDIDIIHLVQAGAANTAKADISRCDRFFLSPFRLSSYQGRKISHFESVLNHRPEGWNWIEYIAAGGECNFTLLANIFELVFKEKEHIQSMAKTIQLFTFEDRCKASGLNISMPAVCDQSFTTTKEVYRRGQHLPPRERIKRMKLSLDEAPPDAPWQFIGVLQGEARIRLELISIAKSWDSTRSAWRAFSEVVEHISPFRPHVPISSDAVSLFAMQFDNPGTLGKYLQHLRKACVICKCDFIPVNEEKAIKLGASKARPTPKRSFIQSGDTQLICKALIKQGKHQLCRYCAVAYTYQLRSQSEGIILQAAELSKQELLGDAWFSAATIGRKHTTIHLRTRKNKNFKSDISRKCYCSETPYCCGKCALDYQVSLAREAKQTKVFWEVSNLDIRTIQQICKELNIPHPTWHGFRRGRITDLVSKKFSGNEPISLEDIFESGGWFSGSRAILHYLRQEVVDRERVIHALAELSDSD